MTNGHIINKHHPRFSKVDIRTVYFLISAGLIVHPGIYMGESVALRDHIQAALLCCSGERLCSGDSTHKRAAGQWGSQWRAPVERATMTVHAGNWAGWYKGMKPSLRPWRTSIQKRGFVCSLSIFRFPWEKTIQTDLKKRILPYASAPYVTLIEGLMHLLLMDVDVIIPLCQYVYSIKAGHKTKRWTIDYLLCSMGSAEKYFLRICSWTDRICVTAEWCVLWRRKKRLQLSWSLYMRRILLLRVIKTAQLEIITLRWQWIKIGSPTVFWTIPHLKQSRGSDPFFF